MMSKKNPRKKRPNPAVGLPGIEDLLANTAGNMAVNAALAGCTLNERLLVAALIPTFLSIIRTGSKKSIARAVDKLYADGIEIEIAPGITMQREPGTANEQPPEATPNAESKEKG